MAQTETTRKKTSLFTLDGMPPLAQATPLALQHVVAMIIGCVTPALIIGNIPQLGLSEASKVQMIQASLVIAAISTLLQLFPIGGRKNASFRFGAGLPVILGISFAYLPSLQGIASTEDGLGLAYIAGSMVVGGVVAMVVGFFIKHIRKFFPTLITGTVIFTIGLSLYPTAINYMAGGAANTQHLVVEVKHLTEALVYGSWQNWVVALITLGVVVSLNHWAKGIAKLASILIGMVAGYLVAICFGMVDFSSIGRAGIVAAPSLLPFGLKFDVGACIAIGVLFFINSIQAIGDFTATTVGGMDREPTDQELTGGIFCYGATNLAAAFFGGLPTATYSQNVGIVVTTKVVNRMVFAMAAIVIFLAGIFPKFSALLTTIPQCVLGGATVMVFSTIAMTGIKLITSEKMDYRATSIVGLSVALGVGISQASASIGQFPAAFTTIFGRSPVVVATIMALLLNQILPRSKDGALAADTKKA